MLFESMVQSVINSVEVGGVRRIVRVALGVLFAGGVILVYAGSQFRGFTSADAMDQAQIGANLAGGRGFSTQVIRPYDAGHLVRNRRSPPAGAAVPDIRHAPLFPAMVSAGLKVAMPRGPVRQLPHRPETGWILLLGGLFFVGTAAILQRLGSLLFSPRAGYAAAALYVFSPPALAQAVSGEGGGAAAFFVLSALLAAVTAVRMEGEDRGRIPRLALIAFAGLLCGLAILTRYSAALVVPVVALFIRNRIGRGHMATLAIFSAVAVLVVAPWLARNVAVSGGLFGTAPAMMLDGAIEASQPVDRRFEPPLRRMDVFPAVGMKVVRNLPGVFTRDLPLAGGGLVACFFFAALFLRTREESAISLKWGTALALGLAAVGQAAGPQARCIDLVLPLVVLAGTGMFIELLEEQGLTGGAAEMGLLLALVIVTAAPTAVRVLGVRPAAQYPPYSPTLISYVAGLVDPGEAIATDIPWATAWYGRRTSVLLPSDPGQLSRAAAATKLPLAGIYLTEATGNLRYQADLVNGFASPWLPLLARKVPEGFAFMHGIELPQGRGGQIFLTDRARWDAAPEAPGR